MILLVGVKCDSITRAFYNFLSSSNEKFLFIEQDQVGSVYKFDEENIYFENNKLNIKNIQGVLNRTTGVDVNQNPEKISKTYTPYLEILNYLIESKLSNVLNKNVDAMSNNSKPFQLVRTVTKNIQIPHTYIIANDFCNQSLHDNYVFKSVSGIRSIVKVVTSEYHNRDITCPVLFQKTIEGNNIRVHVVKDKIFAQEIISSGIDYRYADQSHSKFNLPVDIIDDCFSISKIFNLPLVGIDLIKCKHSGNFFFLEANPAPGFTYFDSFNKDLPISNAVLSALKNH